MTPASVEINPFLPAVRTLDCRGRLLVLDRPRIMGIVNATPDSFAGGRVDPKACIDWGLRLVEEGADILDIGGESTRPGASPVTGAEELARVLPVIAALAERTGVPISVDTSKPEVMRAAIEAGAGMVNDVCALAREGALEAVAESGACACLMHMQGVPATMQEQPQYDDVLGEVHRFLAERLLACQFAGIDPNRLLVDPGFGFGKNLEHNLQLLNGLQRLVSLNAPILVGLSRKSLLGALTGRAVGERIHASVAAALIAVQKGAQVVRVHDVAATRDALQVWQALDHGEGTAVRAREGRAQRRDAWLRQDDE